MKKALVVFLILAVAGGLFAQTVTTKGSVQTGIGIGFTDEEGDAGKPIVDYIRDRGDNGLRGQVDIAFTSADDAAYGKFGANVSFRGVHSKFVANNWEASVPTANLWWTPSSMLRIDLGTGGPGGMGTLGGMDRSQDILDNDGLKVRLTPIAGLNLGAHLFYGRKGATLAFENMNLGFGANYTMSGLVAVAANLRYKAENKDDKTEKIAFGAGANFLGLGGLGFSKIAADFASYGFGTDAFFLGIGEQINYGVGALSAVARARQFIWLGEGSKDFIPMLFRGELYYKVTPIVTVGLEGQYSMGVKPATGSNSYRIAYEVGGPGSAANFDQKDDAALGISPRVTFNVGPEIILGYNLQKDMSKTTGAKTMTHLIYAGVNIGF
jgi:hypothetical protein